MLLDEHVDVIREAVKAVAAEVMEVEVAELIGAEHGQRRPEDRATHRNGYRPRRWDTRAGEIELQIPKLRRGAISRASWSRAGVPSRRCWRSYRLDRGGNRQINAAIHRIAITRARCHPETRGYIARKTSEGKTSREAIRCLKRYLARRIWHLLQPPTPIPAQTITPTS